MSKNTPTLLKTAAEMRSNGASWTAVGRSVGRSPRTCEQWPRLFRPAWEGLYRDAEGRRFTETGGEATAVLQKLLRDGDNRMKLRSADVLLRTRHQQLMREPETALPRSVADTAALKRGRRFQAEKALDEKKPVLQCSADNLPPAAANDPIDVVLCDPTELHSDVAANAEPDPTALPPPVPQPPSPAPACPAPSKSNNFSLRGVAFGVLLLIATLLLTAPSEPQSNASGRFDSLEKVAREPARYRAIPLGILFEKVLNPHPNPLPGSQGEGVNPSFRSARNRWRTRTPSFPTALDPSAESTYSPPPPMVGWLGEAGVAGMASRKWLVRSLCLAFLAALIGGALFLYTWVSPEFIRGELVKQLGDKFNDVDVEVQSAQMRLLGGISVTDLRLVRRDDPNRTPFLHVPFAILYHDKEHLNGGRLVIRKIEMFKPRLRVERDEAGKWNLAGVLKPTTDDETKPLFVFHDASIVFVDRRSGELPVAEWKNIEATLINDPVPVFAFQARGDGRPTGPFAIDGRFDERSGFIGSLDLPAIPVGADLTRAIEAAVPDYGDLAKSLTGKLSAHLDVVWQSGPTPAFYHDLRVQLKEGRYEHAVLPLPLERIEVSFRSKNGDITLEKATARVGGGTISATMDLPKNPAVAPLPGAPKPVGDPLDNIPDRLRRLDISAVDVTISPEIFQILPDKAQAIKEMLLPSGPLSFTYSGRRQEGVWKKNLTLQPNGMEATYRGFPYRVRNLRGTVIATSAEGTPDNIAIDLTGEGLGAPVSIKGTIKGSKPDADIDLTIAGKSATLDDELIDALPDNNPAMLRTLHPSAFGDFEALIRQNPRTRREYGPDTFDNLFTLNIRKGAMKCEAFPIALKEISGTLVIRTVPELPTQLPSSLGAPSPPLKGDSTTLEFKDFRATHNGGAIRGNGRKDPAPGGSILALRLDGEGVALDGDLRQALAAIKMENAWNALEPSGRMNCAMSVKLYTKTDPTAKPNAAEDLELSMAFAGATIRPNFFQYELNRVAGKVAYAKGRIDLREFRAKHGQTELTLPYSEILFRPSGGYWADVRDLRLAPLVIDGDFLQALPPGLKSACEDLELMGPMSLHAARIVVDEQPGPYLPRYLPGAQGTPTTAEREREKQNPSIASAQGRGSAASRPILPTIYWDGSVTMAGASLKTGVPWEDIHGQLASWGLYKGDRLGAVRGNIAFDKATVAKQPVEAFSAQLRVDPRQPDVLSVPAIHGKLYGGDVGGEAWVVLDSPVRYALQLNAAHIRLGDIARHYKLPAKVHLEGLATGEIYLANRFDERTGLPVLQGGGSIDVPSGKLLNLPVLLNLIKVVKLRVPDETGFEEAHAQFYIRGNRLKFGSLDLIGNAISLGGEGEMTLDGKNVHFEFFPVWTKLKEMFAQTGDWTGAISKRFLKIKVSGDIDKLDYKAEPVPGIVDPVKRVLERLKK